MTENLIEGAAPASPAAATSPAADTNVSVDDALLGTLGLDQVDADPNVIADGTYDAVVKSAEMVHTKARNGVAVVINYQITSQDEAGKRIGQFFNLGINPVIEDGKIKSFTPTMTTGNKQWFKKAFTDLGIPEAEVTTTPTSTLMTKIVGRNCTIGVKKRDGYRNVTFVEYRPSAPTTQDAVAAAMAAQNQPAGSESAAPAQQSPTEPPPF